MLALGLGKLDCVPEGDLLPLLAQKFEAEMHMYQHQAVANTFYSLARLQLYLPSICDATQQHVREHLDDYSPQVGATSLCPSQPFALHSRSILYSRRICTHSSLAWNLGCAADVMLVCRS